MAAPRAVKFADLLTQPAEFAPLPAAASPSSQFETISDTSSDGTPAEAEAPVPVVLPVAPGPEPSSAASPDLPGPPALAAPLPDPAAPPADLAVPPESPVPDLAAPPESPVPDLAAPAAAPLASVALSGPSLAGLPAPPATLPPLPDLPAAAPGAAFNYPGLETAFPVAPSSLPGFSVVPLGEAGVAAAALAGPARVNLPGVTPLQDGSSLVAVPAPAVSLARISQPCFAALRGAAHRGALQTALRAAGRVVKQPDAEDGYAQLQQALQLLQEGNVGACDPTLAAALGAVTQLLAKRRALATAQEAVELTYLQHAQEFRALKQDLQALAAVLRLDAQAVEAARQKRARAQAKLGGPLLDGVQTLGRYLQQLDLIAARLA